MRSSLHHLARRGTAQTWYCIKAVPKELRGAFGGKHHLIKSLETKDKAVALAKRNAALDDLEKAIWEVRQPAQTADVMEAAMILNKTYREIPADDSFNAYLWQDGIEEATAELAARYSPAVANAFHGVATGTATMLQAHLEAWLSEPGHKGPLNERTKDQRKSVLNALERWLQANGHPATIEAISKPVAGAFITDTFIGPGVHPITANSKISVLSSYWKWLMRRTGAALNPWANQSFRKPSKRTNGEKTKRPFSHDELIALLSGKADQEMADAIRIGALSGMRLEEVYRLKVADCTGRLFNVRVSKSDAGVRQVPVHTALTEIVERRTKGKNAGDFLMHEAGKADGRERSSALSQRFGRYRQSVGVHDRADGARHSRVDFHSCRRWFITEARKGFDRAVVAAIVGHENGNITDDVYSGGPDMDTRRKCVESVKLPAPAAGSQHTDPPNPA